MAVKMPILKIIDVTFESLDLDWRQCSEQSFGSLSANHY